MACLKFLALAFITLPCALCALHECRSGDCAVPDDAVSFMQLLKQGTQSHIHGLSARSKGNPEFKDGTLVTFKLHSRGFKGGKSSVQFGGRGGVNKFENRLYSDAYKFAQAKGLFLKVTSSEFQIEDGFKFWTYCLEITQSLRELGALGFKTNVDLAEMPEHLEPLCNFGERELVSKAFREKENRLEQTQCPNSCHGFYLPSKHAATDSWGRLKLQENHCGDLGKAVDGCLETAEDFSKDWQICHTVDCRNYDGPRAGGKVADVECKKIDGVAYTYGTVFSWYSKEQNGGKTAAEIKKIWEEAPPAKCP